MRRFYIHRLVWGGLVLLAGVLYLLFNIGALPLVWKPIILSWQMLLILIGIIHITRRHYFGAVLFTAIGVIFLLPQLSVVFGFTYSSTLLHSIIWPLVIILVGVLMITHISHHDCNCDHHHCHGNHHHRGIHKGNNDGRIDYNLIMNGVDEIFLDPVFRGGEINIIMSGVKLDLRKTTLPEGETGLKVDSIMGGVSLFIPENWCVEVRSDSLLGSFYDNRSSNGKYVDRKLVIDSNLILSGGEIKC